MGYQTVTFPSEVGKTHLVIISSSSTNLDLCKSRGGIKDITGAAYTFKEEVYEKYFNSSEQSYRYNYMSCYIITSVSNSITIETGEDTYGAGVIAVL